MEKVTDQELESLKSISQEVGQAHSRVADLSVAKYQMIKILEDLSEKRNELVSVLAKKYGSDSTISLETGEVKRKENGKDSGIPNG
jgi:viroplasmin and RNaseH domain-containing protein